MKHFIMNGSVDIALAEKFTAFANSYPEEKWLIYLNTTGGLNIIADMIARIINRHSPGAELIIDRAFSAGFSIAFKTTCKKVLWIGSAGMLHWSKHAIDFNDKKKPYYDEDECIVKNIPLHRKESEQIASAVMTKKEFTLFSKKNHNIYFDFKRMKQIFPDAEIIK